MIFFFNIFYFLFQVLKKRMFIYLWLSCKLSLVVVSGFLTVAASLVVEHGLLSSGSVAVAPRPHNTGSGAAMHGLRRSAARGVFLDRG